MRYRALLTALLLCGTAGGASASTETRQCARSANAVESSQALPIRDGPAQP
jgi:hypothetical protein